MNEWFFICSAQETTIIVEQEIQLSLTNRATSLEVKVTKHGTIPYVRYCLILVCYSNFVSKSRLFSHIRLQKMSWPWNPSLRLLKVIDNGTIRFDRLCMVSYYSSLVTLSVRYSTWLRKLRITTSETGFNFHL